MIDDNNEQAQQHQPLTHEIIDIMDMLENPQVTPQPTQPTAVVATPPEKKRAQEMLHARKVYHERGHMLACLGGLEVGRAEGDTLITAVDKIDLAVLRDTRNGLPVGAVVRQCTGDYTTFEVWPPLFLERTRGRTVGQAAAYRRYYESLADPAFVASELMALYGRQTEDEQRVKDTVERNERGFCAFSGRAGSRLAEKVMNGQALTGDDLARAVGICLRHRRQVITGQ